MKQHSPGFKLKRNSFLFILSAFIFFTACNNPKKKVTEVKEISMIGMVVDTTWPKKKIDSLEKLAIAGAQYFELSDYYLDSTQQDKLFANRIKQFNLDFDFLGTNAQGYPIYGLIAWGTDGTELGEERVGTIRLEIVQGSQRTFPITVKHYLQRIYRGSLKTFYESGGLNSDIRIPSEYFRKITLSPASRLDIYNDISVYFRVTSVTPAGKKANVPIETKPSPPARPCEEMGGCDLPDELYDAKKKDN